MWYVGRRSSSRGLKLAIWLMAAMSLARSGTFVAVASDAADAAHADAGWQRVSAFLQNEIAIGTISGAVALIEQHDRPVYFKCFGVSNAATHTPMMRETLFALHSMTKPITSVAAMMLIDDGKLSLDDPVAKYIPQFAATMVGIEVTANGVTDLTPVVPDRPMTIRDLLRHTSGISYEYIGSDAMQAAYARADIFAGDVDNAVFAERIAALPLAAQPGRLWRYGHSTDVLGRVIEVVSGQTLFAFEQQRLFGPLQMDRTYYGGPTDADRGRMAEPLPDDRELLDSERMRRAQPYWQSGGGGLVSTLDDYSQFARMILHRGELHGRRYLSAKSYAAMTTDQIGPGSGIAKDADYFPGDAFGFGYGFAVRIETAHVSSVEVGPVGVLQWDSGSGTAFFIDPMHDMIAVLMVQVGAQRGRVQQGFKKAVYEALGR